MKCILNNFLKILCEYTAYLNVVLISDNIFITSLIYGLNSNEK
jgi:hypothetical protein